MLLIILVIALVLAACETVYGAVRRSWGLFMVGAVLALALGAALMLYLRYADAIYLDGTSKIAHIITKEMMF